MHKFGSTLIGVSVFIFVAALVRMLSGMLNNSNSMLRLSYFLIFIALLVFWAGHWFKKQAQTRGVAKRIAHAKAKWWGTDYGFRLTAFAAALWVFGTQIFVDSYDRSTGLVFGPVVVLFAAYYGYKHLVVGSKAHGPIDGALPEQALAGDSQHHESMPQEPAKPNEPPVTTSLDRERSMDELIKRMKSNG